LRSYSRNFWISNVKNVVGFLERKIINICFNVRTIILSITLMSTLKDASNYPST
jgi:hypothetical protein